MAIILDDQALDANALGFRTVGQVLAYVQRTGRLAIRLLIDGEAPGAEQMELVKPLQIGERTVYIESVDARQTALDSLAEAGSRLEEAEAIKAEAADLLRGNQIQEALGKLSECATRWQQGQQTVMAVSRYFSIDLKGVDVEGKALSEFLEEFAGQLRDIQKALAASDWVGVTDLLVYEMEGCGASWRGAMQGLGVILQPLKVQSAA